MRRETQDVVADEYRDHSLIVDAGVVRWDTFVRRVYDKGTKNIFITGSNARLLSSEIATSLRGRTISYEVFPLSFREYLDFKGIEPDVNSTRSIAQINHHLADYLRHGGFPEVVGYDDAIVAFLCGLCGL